MLIGYLSIPNLQLPFIFLTNIGSKILEYCPDGRFFLKNSFSFLPVNFVSISFKEKTTLNSCKGILKEVIISLGLALETVCVKLSTLMVSENDFSSILSPSFDMSEMLSSKEDSKLVFFFKNCRFLLNISTKVITSMLLSDGLNTTLVLKELIFEFIP